MLRKWYILAWFAAPPQGASFKFEVGVCAIRRQPNHPWHKVAVYRRSREFVHKSRWKILARNKAVPGIIQTAIASAQQRSYQLVAIFRRKPPKATRAGYDVKQAGRTKRRHKECLVVAGHLTCHGYCGLSQLVQRKRISAKKTLSTAGKIGQGAAYSTGGQHMHRIDNRLAQSI